MDGCRGLRLASEWPAARRISLLVERLLFDAVLLRLVTFGEQDVVSEELVAHLDGVEDAVAGNLPAEHRLLHELLVLQLFEHLEADGVADKLDVLALSEVLEVLEVVLELLVGQKASFLENW